MPNFPTYDFHGKTIFIAGAETGIGRETALAFANSGASVALVGLQEEKLKSAADEIQKSGVKALPLFCDVREELQVKEALEKTVQHFGGLDFAFNNAGVEQPVTKAHEISSEMWQRIMSTNLTGIYNCVKHQASLMERSKFGVIVNTSSGAGVIGIEEQAAYCAEKWGLIGFSKAAALDYAAEGVRINVICPGFVDTPMMKRFIGGTPEGIAKVKASEPVGRAAQPAEIAQSVLWLCSDAGAFVTGSAIVLNGGQTV